jgi:hypothetical protein
MISRFTPLLFTCFCLLAFATRGFAKDTANDPEISQAWKDRLGHLHARKNVYARFTEERHYKFKTEPIRIQGEIRFVQNQGISISYEGEEARKIWLNADGGVLIQKSDKPVKKARMPVQAMQVIKSLATVIDFSPDAYKKDFDLDLSEDEKGWQMTLRPKAKDLAKRLSTLVILGKRHSISNILLNLSNGKEIIIHIEEESFPESFSAWESSVYFLKQ